jgi:hypothetical protein
MPPSSGLKTMNSFQSLMAQPKKLNTAYCLQNTILQSYNCLILIIDKSVKNDKQHKTLNTLAPCNNISIRFYSSSQMVMLCRSTNVQF